MCDAAGKPSDSFNFLCLAQSLLDTRALDHLAAQLLVRFLECQRSLRHEIFKLFGCTLLRLEQFAHLVLPRARSAALIVLVSVIGCTGRSRIETFPSSLATLRLHSTIALGSRWLVSRMNGRSDHAG